MVIMIAGLIGARLTHVLYEDLNYYLAYPLDIFKLWQGGYVFYGGMLTALGACFYFLKSKNESFLKWADFFAPAIALGYALGRVGCFLTGCCFGKETTMPWGIELAGLGLPMGPRHPTQLYATFWELIVLSILLHFEKRKTFSREGMLFYSWLSMHAFGRLLMEHYREDFRGPEIFGASVSSLISLILLMWGTRALYKKHFARR